MNLLQDMGLKEEHQSVMEHLDQLEQQIVQANRDDQERMDALNRALYGQAVAEQERRQLAQQKAAVSAAAESTEDLAAMAPSSQQAPEARRAHPFAPQVVIVGGGTAGEVSEDESELEATYPGDNADVLLSFQAQEQALHDEQQDSFFNFSLQRSLSATRVNTAEEEWSLRNSAHRVSRAGGTVDDQQVRGRT